MTKQTHKSMHIDRASIGKRVFQARIKSGYEKQSLLAKALDVSRYTVSKAEKGNIETLRFDTIIAMCQLLNISLDWLVYGNERGRRNHELHQWVNELTRAQELALLSIIEAFERRQVIEIHPAANDQDL